MHLGDIEFRLLSLFVKDPGVLHEHNELLNKVWGANALGEVQYLRVACARLRRKFEDAGLDGGNHFSVFRCWVRHERSEG